MSDIDDMIERVARAIWAERVRYSKDIHGIDLEEWGRRMGHVPAEGEPDVAHLSNVAGEARVAIEAMREMTPEMKEALIYYGMLDGQPDEAWEKTIDAALTKRGQ